MKIEVDPSRARREGGILLKILVVLMVVTLAGIVAVGALVCWWVRPDRVFRELQAGVLEEMDTSLRVSVRAPETLVSLARLGLTFVDEVDEEARLAIRSVRGGQAGFYQLRKPVSGAERISMMRRADEAMSANRWDRIAAVMEKDEMVLVYVPADLDESLRLEVMTVVLGERELVIASVEGDLRSIGDLVKPRFEQIAGGLGGG